MQIEFGFHPSPLSISIGDIEILTLPDLDQTVALVVSDGVENEWVYAPPQEIYQFGSSGRGIRTMPYASRVFSLPKTHVLRHATSEDNDHLAFLLWALSFFKGIRLTASEAGFVDTTPITSGKLVDFGLYGSNLTKAIALAEGFWFANRAEPMRAKRFAATVHALFLGQNPQLLQFERFIFLYAALDACFTLASPLHSPPRRPTHADRITWMCSLFGMATPAWADKGAAGKAEIAVLRNDTLHEALFMGKPLGFALHGVGTNLNLTLEMEALVCRLLVALLGASTCDYVRTAVNTRQRFLLTL